MHTRVIFFKVVKTSKKCSVVKFGNPVCLPVLYATKILRCASCLIKMNGQRIKEITIIKMATGIQALEWPTKPEEFV